MFNKFQAHISNKKFFKPEEKLILAISGGIDSMVLLHLFERLPFNICVAHIDHSTREGASTLDAEFLADYCNKKSIEFHSKKLKKTTSHGKNKQAYFRDARYHFFNSLQKDKIVTAHHSNDNIETIFMNLINGKSLRGIPEINNNIIRPLLAFSRKEIEAYAKENNIYYREDHSNHENIYTRNFIRNEILSQLEKHDKNFNAKLVGFSKRHLEDEKLLQSLSENIYNPVTKEKRIYIDKNKIVNNSPRLLYHFVRKYGFNFDQAKNIVKRTDKVGATFLSNDKTILIDRSQIIIADTFDDSLYAEIDLRDLPKYLTNGSYSLKFEKASELHEKKDKNVGYFPLRKLGNTLIIRNWKHGDYFLPSGMDGQSQSLKKFFVNNKVDQFTKKQLPLVLSGDDIIWICGKRTNEKYRISKDEEILKISFSSF